MQQNISQTERDLGYVRQEIKNLGRGLSTDEQKIIDSVSDFANVVPTINKIELIGGDGKLDFSNVRILLLKSCFPL